jgi:hypothetical protein
MALLIRHQLHGVLIHFPQYYSQRHKGPRLLSAAAASVVSRRTVL